MPLYLTSFISKRPHAMRAVMPAIFMLHSLACIPFLDANETAPTPIMLVLEEVYAEIVDHTYELKAANAEVAARAGERMQAQALPNPDLALELDTISQNSYCDENELTLTLTQLVELGGKRSARMRVADADQCAAAWEVEILRRDLYTQLLQAFIEIATIQEHVALALAQHEISTKTLACSSQKNAAGKTSILETKKAEVACRSLKIQHAKQQVALERAKKHLLALWKHAPCRFDCVSFPLYELTPPPALEKLSAQLADNPYIAKGQALLLRAWEVVALEKADAVPDVAVMVGVSTERFYRGPCLNVGIDIPLPIFDQNRGNICRAINEYNRAYYLQMSAIYQLETSLAMLHEEWCAAYEQAMALKDSILPAAQENYQLSLASYQEGKFDYLDLLDAQSMLFDVRQQYLEAAHDYHTKRAEILKLTTRQTCEN